ncbi:ArsR/SmtB family transcription factor [Aciditerrimonas ferrireducens]|jgi:ArsR family transcriptional regulator|uniref:ArsR/SmtB family transcription factor n=1 Tax=Aciditerrimonas ferrireducens TaxID=667306 RepID=A0ABV6BZ94_9ACTN|nr:metalloregulator ArsR/SmtB family transcription factor [Aciditerrimonas ferrireducens]MCK4177271.1 metalloregulator ArsR/SmtB family transcription factor [Aciditerrimonas ferrireducens]
MAKHTTSEAGRPKTIEPRLRQELEELVAEMCKALNEPKRLMVLYALAERPRSVGELAAYLDAPQSNTSQHLAVLRDRGLVDVERRGNRVIYSLRYPKVIAAIDLLREVLNEEIGRQHQLRSA